MKKNKKKLDYYDILRIKDILKAIIIILLIGIIAILLFKGN